MFSEQTAPIGPMIYGLIQNFMEMVHVKNEPGMLSQTGEIPLSSFNLAQVYLPYFDKQCVVFEKIAFLFLLSLYPFIKNGHNFKCKHFFCEIA